jgi:CubicO group peptidase (beta-lactamase class C family)
MLETSRRAFGKTIAAAFMLPGSVLRGEKTLDRSLRAGFEGRKIPTAAAMVATSDRTLYSGWFGYRDSASGMRVSADSLFDIASMTKAITSTAALHLVEQGKIMLDEPVAK